MSIAILYTTSDSIRSIIGLDENDISDAMMGACNLDLRMLDRLADIRPDYEVFADASDINSSRMTLWCQLFGAFILLDETQLGIPQKIQANNDQLSRFTVDFEKLKDSIKTRLSAIERKIIPSKDIATYSIINNAIPSVDPITG